MSQRAYSHLTDGTQALIVQFVKEPENDELLLKAFNEVASNNALNAKEVKNLAIDEFRKEIQHLATKDELNGLRYELITTKEALQGQIDGVHNEISSLKNELQAQIFGVRNELKGDIAILNNKLDDKVELLDGKIANLAKLESRNFKFIAIILGAIIVNSIGVVAVLIKSFL